MFIFDSTGKAHAMLGKPRQRLDHTKPGTMPKPIFVPKIGGWGDLLPLMEFNDCSMSAEEVGGSVRYEVWVLRHSSATIIAALQQL